jgi:poly-beta-1,6-N-acetyl-D-glucosamine biosynthesis protein PgaD
MRAAWTRQLDWALTGFLWLLYVYMIRQAFIDVYYLTIDAFDWGFGGNELASLPAMSGFLRTLRDYGIVVVVIGATLISWGLYNQIRFRGRDRRRHREQVGIADLAVLYALPAESISAWQGSRVLVMEHAPDGTLVSVTSKSGERIPPLPRRTVALKEAV